MSVFAMRSVGLPSGEKIPALGMGTWNLAEGRHPRKVEIEALRAGIDLGMTLVDTAELYAHGESERLVGEAIAGRRGEVFLVGKVRPGRATREGTYDACAESLARLATDYFDLYLLHWRGSVPLEETVAGFEDLERAGLIRHWGVSNFDLGDLTALLQLPGGGGVRTDQVLYNLAHRGIEWTLLPWSRQLGVPLMAYSPLDQGRLAAHPVLRGIATRHKATAAQVALAWVVAHPSVCAIAEAGTPGHVRENARAAQVDLGEDDLLELDAAFPPPSRPSPLEVL
jgi:diketogulonate reductase-like aldo/keto reductase